MTSSSLHILARRQVTTIMISSLFILLSSSPSLFVMGKKPSPAVKCIKNTDGTNNPSVIYHLSNNELRPYPNMDFYYWNGYDKNHFPGVGRHIDCTGLTIGPPYDVQPETIVSEEAYKFIPMYKMRTDQKCQPGPATRHEVGKCRVDRPVDLPIYYENSIVQEEELNGSPSTLHSYWVYYGMQNSCGPFDAGKHKDDWEHVDIHVQDGDIKHVIYSQHGGMYTLSKKNVPMENGRVVVYVGKYAHGSYHDQRKKCNFDSGCKSTGEYCKYWKDPRTGKSYDWYPHKLLSLPGFRLQQDSVPIDDPVCKLETGGFEWGGVELEGPTNTCRRNPRYLTYTNKAEPMTARDMMLGNYRPGSGVKCTDNTDNTNNPRVVYRFQDRTLRPYPSLSIFKSWDPKYHYDYIDCTHFPIGRPMGYNFNNNHEGHSIKCIGSTDGKISDHAVYRWTDGKLRHYPNALIALSWNRFWNKILTIDCRGLPIGAPMKKKVNSPQEGQAIKCTGAHHVYRWTNNQLRHYPNPEIFSSWNGGDNSSSSAFCGGQHIGKPMTWNVQNLPEGKSLRCNGSRKVYRWTNNQLRLYPSRDIFGSCDGDWSNVGNIDCRGLAFGNPMGPCHG